MPSINDKINSASHSVRITTDATLGVELFVMVFNPKIDEWNKKTVMLLHGFPEYWAYWRPQVDALVDAGFQVVIPDQRGYNKSSKPPTTKNGKNYQINELADDAIAVMDYLKLDKVMLAGHDFGGAVSWWLAMRNPERIERMVILCMPHLKAFFPAWKTVPAQKQDSIYIENFLAKKLSSEIVKSTKGGVLALSMTTNAKKGTFDDDTMDAFRTAWLRKANGDPVETPGLLAQAVSSVKNALTHVSGYMADYAEDAENTGEVASTPWSGQAMLNWYSGLVNNWNTWKDNPANFAWPSRNGVVNVPTLVLEGEFDAFFITALLAPTAALCKADGSGAKVVLDTTHWMGWEAPKRVNRILVNYFRNSRILDDDDVNTKDVSKY